MDSESRGSGASPDDDSPYVEQTAPAPPPAVARAFPFTYRPQQDLTLEVADGFAGVVVVVPQGINADNKMDFKIALGFGKDASPVTFRPRALGMMVIDVREGFVVTPESLSGLVRKAWLDGAGRPPPPDVVTGGN